MISGVWENWEGSTDYEGSLAYWREFGYRPVAEGSLSAEQARALYGHASAVRGARLQHGNADDHGMIRIQAWDTLRNQGVGVVPPLTRGGRWFIANAGNLLLLHDTFSDMRDAGVPILLNDPQRNVRGDLSKPATVLNRREAVREMMALTADHRQAWFARFNYDRAGYGLIDWSSPMQASEGTHSTIIVRDGDQCDFYAEALGLTLVGLGGGNYGDHPGDTSVLMVQPGQGWLTKRYLDPKNPIGMVVFQWPTFDGPDLLDNSRPGSRGLCCFSWAVDDAGAYHARVAAASPKQISAVLPNEFGEPSFSFIAPDDVSWVIVEKADVATRHLPQG
jgi:hypothetical protein